MLQSPLLQEKVCLKPDCTTVIVSVWKTLTTLRKNWIWLKTLIFFTVSLVITSSWYMEKRNISHKNWKKMENRFGWSACFITKVFHKCQKRTAQFCYKTILRISRTIMGGGFRLFVCICLFVCGSFVWLVLGCLVGCLVGWFWLLTEASWKFRTITRTEQGLWKSGVTESPRLTW